MQLAPVSSAKPKLLESAWLGTLLLSVVTVADVVLAGYPHGNPGKCSSSRAWKVLSDQKLYNVDDC